MGYGGLALRFLLIALPVLGLSLWFHLLWQDSARIPRGSDMIYLSYIINFLLAAGIFYFLYGMRKKYKNQLGFMYMGGSLFKFIVFFVIFYPDYRADGMVTRSEFGTFFIPYLLCLILETVFTAKMLLREPKG
jgi:hypothetical protein